MKRGAFLYASAAAAGTLSLRFAVAAGEPLSLGAYLTLESSGSVVVTIPMADIGQGVATALARALADELDADWSAVRVDLADADPAKYRDQGIGGSRTMRKNTLPFRQAGADARALMVAAAAAVWRVSAATCRTSFGFVYHDETHRSIPYRYLLRDAAHQTTVLPAPLKQPEQFVYIGKPAGLLDAGAKASGALRYCIDLRRKGMAYAVLERAPRIGASLHSCEATAAHAVPGVLHVVKLEQKFAAGFPFRPAVAVVGDSYWSALSGRKALVTSWTPGPNAAVDDAAVRGALHEGLVAADAFIGRSQGDVEAAFAGAARTVEATYETPLQAHCTLEPQNAIADVRDRRCEIWAPTQSPQAVQRDAAKITGLELDAVIVHQLPCGGGFGRLSDDDYVVEAVVLSKRLRLPIKVVWTREDTLRFDVYRPPHMSGLRAALDANGKVLALAHRRAGPTIGIQRGYAKRDAVDLEALDGMLDDLPYTFPAYRAEFKLVESVPVYFGWWRAVSAAQNLFASEGFVDELAHAAHADSYEYRRAMLVSNPRALAVLDRAASAAGWSRPPVPNVGRGIALAPYGKTLVAQVAEVTLDRKRRPRVRRVVCAIDCGMPVNPKTIEAQVEGGIVWALGATLMHAITLERGAVVQQNFDSYRLARIGDVPEILVEIVSSESDPTGVGEAAVPALAPAVANALFALTGRRLRRLPLLAG